MGSPPAATPITFAEIVEEELQQEAALIRSREKPLALIQVNNNAWYKKSGLLVPCTHLILLSMFPFCHLALAGPQGTLLAARFVLMILPYGSSSRVSGVFEIFEGWFFYWCHRSIPQ